MDGVSATKEIRKLQKNGKINKCFIVALTANVREIANDILFDDYLCKPLTRESLKGMLLKIYDETVHPNELLKV